MLERLQMHGNAATKEAKYIEELKDYFKFSFVRNPWDRWLSWYSFLVKANKKTNDIRLEEFEHFLEETLVEKKGIDAYFHINQIDFLKNQAGHIIVDHIGRFEQFEIELQSIFSKLDLPLKEIPLINESFKKDYRLFYTPKSKALVEEYCAEDIRYFDYRF